MKYVVGIDIGTSGCKSILVDEKGNVVGVASKEYNATLGANGYAAQDPDDWYQAFIVTLHQLCSENGVDLKDIVALSATGQMQGCTFIGKDGNSVRDSLLWYDTSPDKEVTQFNDKYEEIFRRNCNMSSTTSLTGSKIKWVMNHEPETWKSVDKFTFAPCYITYRLTGRLSVDTNNLGLSGLNSVKNNSWSKELIDITGIEEEKIPELTGCFDVLGNNVLFQCCLSGSMAANAFFASSSLNV